MNISILTKNDQAIYTKYNTIIYGDLAGYRTGQVYIRYYRFCPFPGWIG